MSTSNATKAAKYLQFRPKLVSCLKDYTKESFFADLGAGITVGIVALPLAIGLGIASGVSPGTGIFTAIIGGFLVALLGGSKVQIGGPAGAFVGMVYAIIAQYGLPNLLLCTMLAGVILFALGALRLGTLIKFVPHPVTTGFTCGIAVTIIATQVKDFLGLQIDKVPAEFIHKMVAFGQALPTINWWTAGVGIVSLLIIRYWPDFGWRKLPGSIVAVVFVTGAVALFRIPVATIESAFGGIPRSLPPFQVLDFDWKHLGDIIRPAVAIALLGGIESLLSAVVADGMVDDRHDSNQELMAQGVANFVVPLFGGIPVTGVIARTATNIRNGANSPIAGIIHAVVLLLIVLVASPLAKFIPIATLAAVLVMVAYNMGEWGEFMVLKRMARSDAIVFLVTFVLTVLFDLTVAVEIGLLLAAVLFIKRVTDTTQVSAFDEETEAAKAQGHEKVTHVPEGVLIYRLFGALLFGAADKLDSVLHRATGNTRIIILHMPAVMALDGTALNTLEEMNGKLKRQGRHLILSGPHTQPYFLMEKSGFLERLGYDNVAGDLESAVGRARALLPPPKMKTGHGESSSANKS